jgi:uncharacterized membrane protein
MDWIDCIGYLGAALVVGSFLVKNNMRLLRIISLLGAITFIIYGVLLNFNLPVIIPNAAITCIHVYYLFIRKDREVKREMND